MTEEYGRLLATGASVVKVDFGEELPDEAVYADGTPAERMRNLYPLRYQEAVHAATAAARGEGERIAWTAGTRVAAMTRPGSASATARSQGEPAMFRGVAQRTRPAVSCGWRRHSSCATSPPIE